MMKTMRYVLLLLVCFTATKGFAQDQPSKTEGDKGGKIEALRIAFISQRLNLTADEAEKFWPVFNAYRDDLSQLRKNFKVGAGNPSLTADQQLDFEQKKLDLKKKYKSRFDAVLGSDKVNILYNIEEEFRQKLKEFHDQREHNRGQGPPPGKRP